MFVILQLAQPLLKRVFAPACAAVLNARLVLQLGWELQIRFRELCD